MCLKWQILRNHPDHMTPILLWIVGHEATNHIILHFTDSTQPGLVHIPQFHDASWSVQNDKGRLYLWCWHWLSCWQIKVVEFQDKLQGSKFNYSGMCWHWKKNQKCHYGVCHSSHKKHRLAIIIWNPDKCKIHIP